MAKAKKTEGKIEGREDGDFSEALMEAQAQAPVVAPATQEQDAQTFKEEQEALVKAQQDAQAQEDEKNEEGSAENPIFIAPYDVYRAAQDGDVVSNDGMHVVFKAADGKHYAVPHTQDSHRTLKEGDKFTF